MIIVCINCTKKFEIDSDLIPTEGRLLQCGDCNHQWFFKKKIEDLTIKKNIDKTNEIVVNTPTTNDVKYENKVDSQPITNDIKKNITLQKTHKISENKVKFNFLKLIFVFIISFTALIILVDTFKYPISKVIPNIEFILYNLYETVKDIKLFLYDLI